MDFDYHRAEVLWNHSSCGGFGNFGHTATRMIDGLPPAFCVDLGTRVGATHSQ